MASFLNPVRLVTNKTLADSIGSRKSFIFSIFCFVGGLVATAYLGFGVIGVLGWAITSGVAGGFLYKGLSALDSWANFGNPDRDYNQSQATRNGSKIDESENEQNDLERHVLQEVQKPHFTSELKNTIQEKNKNEKAMLNEDDRETEKLLKEFELDQEISKNGKKIKETLKPISTKNKEAVKSV